MVACTKVVQKDKNEAVTSLPKKTYEAYQAGEKRSFVFICNVEIVSLYHSKLVWVVLDLIVKEFFRIRF